MQTFWYWIVRRLSYVACFGVLVLLFYPTLSLSSPQAPPTPIAIDSGFVERTIGLNLFLFEDASGKLELEQIRSPELASQFSPSNQTTPNFGYTTSAIWIRLALNDLRQQSGSATLEPLYLALAFAITDKAELWCSNTSGQLVTHQRAGDHVPRAEWPNPYREPVFKLDPGVQSCWLRVQSSASLQLPLTLYSQEAFVNLRLHDNAIQALYFGALLVMLLYNASVAVSTRSRSYAFYTLFLLSYGLLQCALSGFGYALLWVNAIGYADTLIPFFIACVGMNSVIFAMILLDLRQNSPRWYQVGVVVLFLCSFTLVLPWILTFSQALQTSLLLIPLWAFFLLGSGTYLVIKGLRIAKIYLAAWLIFIVGAVLAGSLTWLPANALTINAMQIGSVIEFIMLSFALSDRIKTIQTALLNAQKKIADTLRASEQELDLKVKERTAELQERTAQLQEANTQIHTALTQSETAKQWAEKALQQAEAAQFQAEVQHQHAEEARQQTAQTLEELKATQNQLIAAEKMASLGLLVSNVAHEINTPIGAVKSSGTLIADTLDATLANMPKLFSLLEPAPLGLFMQLVTGSKASTQPWSMREERAAIKKLTAELKQANVEDASKKAKLLVKFHAHEQAMDYLPLLNHEDADFILKTASDIADIVNSTHNINTAVDKVSRVVYALKALSGEDMVKTATLAHLQTDMDKALAKYQNQMQNVELVKNYQPDMPPMHANHDAVEQLCIHLVMNALQAMNYSGKLTVGLKAENTLAIISVTDNGPGISEEVKGRIFEPFFTTLTSGEGSGMGLAIVKRIVEQHQGQIDVQTEVGMGTTFRVSLPYSH